MKPELKQFAETLRAAGFDVYVPNNETSQYFKFRKDGHWGYVQENTYRMGYDFSTVHRASRANGTGHVYKQETELTLENAERTIKRSREVIEGYHTKNIDLERNPNGSDEKWIIEHYTKL